MAQIGPQVGRMLVYSALLFTLGHASSIGRVNLDDDFDGPTPHVGLVYFEDDHRQPQVAYLNGLDPTMKSKNPDSNIAFYLYTDDNPTKEYRLIIDDTSNLRESHFNAKYPTKILIHGFSNSYKSPFAQNIKDEYLKGNKKYNIIVVDWHKLSGAPWYYSATVNTMDVGIHTAKLVDYLISKANLKLSNLHIVGHSLGAHIAGIVGKHLTSGVIARITALDAALPLYEHARKKWRIVVGDAEFVDAIHTSGGDLGFLKPVGDADFYPNKGLASQPGCGFDLTASCSHSRSWEYYVESITQTEGFPTKECESLEQAQKAECESSRDETPMMGEAAYNDDESESGIFYTETNKRKPFAINP